MLLVLSLLELVRWHVLLDAFPEVIQCVCCFSDLSNLRNLRNLRNLQGLWSHSVEGSPPGGGPGGQIQTLGYDRRVFGFDLK